jgi:hypothetical protein
MNRRPALSLYREFRRSAQEDGSEQETGGWKSNATATATATATVVYNGDAQKEAVDGAPLSSAWI